MEVLLWLAPAVVVTAVAMTWAAWAGRDRGAEVDRDDAVRRMGQVLEPGRRPGPGYAVPRTPRERSTGVALRRTRPVRVRPVPPVSAPTPRPPAEPGDAPTRRAS